MNRRFACGMPEGSLSRLEEFIARWIRQARRLFHMMVGLAFFGLAGAGAAVAWKLWGDYRQAPSNGVVAFAAVTSFTALLVILGLYSFLKARSVR